MGGFGEVLCAVGRWGSLRHKWMWSKQSHHLLSWSSRSCSITANLSLLRRRWARSLRCGCCSTISGIGHTDRISFIPWPLLRSLPPRPCCRKSFSYLMTTQNFRKRHPRLNVSSPHLSPRPTLPSPSLHLAVHPSSPTINLLPHKQSKPPRPACPQQKPPSPSIKPPPYQEATLHNPSRSIPAHRTAKRTSSCSGGSSPGRLSSPAASGAKSFPWVS